MRYKRALFFSRSDHCRNVLTLKELFHTPGGDEHLLVLGGHTRAPSVCLMSLIGAKYFLIVVVFIFFSWVDINDSPRHNEK